MTVYNKESRLYLHPCAHWLAAESMNIVLHPEKDCYLACSGSISAWQEIFDIASTESKLCVSRLSKEKEQLARDALAQDILTRRKLLPTSTPSIDLSIAAPKLRTSGIGFEGSRPFANAGQVVGTSGVAG